MIGTNLANASRSPCRASSTRPRSTSTSDAGHLGPCATLGKPPVLECMGIYPADRFKLSSTWVRDRVG